MALSMILYLSYIFHSIQVYFLFKYLDYVINRRKQAFFFHGMNLSDFDDNLEEKNFTHHLYHRRRRRMQTEHTFSHGMPSETLLYEWVDEIRVYSDFEYEGFWIKSVGS